ncbi:MAG: FAD-dependent oxidoreductase, partial [Candidatus Obscuribacterales bacterium]|nr:FAD-dependent oxidoreductase [Candidatus Obscuribacterales bacterium]
MSRDYEYCIIGGGIVGSAAAYLIARTGSSVLLFEQFEFGHERGSSHGESRIIRYSYDHPTYLEMARGVYPLWQEIEKESGKPLLRQTGGIDLDEEGGIRISACRENFQQAGIKHEVLDLKEINKRFPQFRLAKNTQGLYQENTGLLDANLCLQTLQDLALKNGATLCDKTVVDRFEYEGKSINVHFGEKRIKAKKLIIT